MGEKGEVVSTSFVNGHDLLEWMCVLSGGEFCGGVVQPKFQGNNSAMRFTGWSAMRAST